MFWLIISTIFAAFMAVTMIFVRLKAAQKPASVKKIILPPLFMSTGSLMFLFPEFRVDMLQILEAIAVGAAFSIFLIKTSNFDIKDGHIYLIPSKSFVFILFGLLIIRIIIKFVIGSTISLGETSGMFFLLAFAMIISWRLTMLYKFKKLENELRRSVNS